MRADKAMDSLPAHIGIIMDGNGRWSHQHGLPRHRGHQPGAEAARRIVEAASEIGIRYLTLYGFSRENWRRPRVEIAHFLDLLRDYLRNQIHRLREIDVRARVIGERSLFPADILELIEYVERETDGNSRMCLTIALSYSSRCEIAGAARRLARLAVAGELDPEEIDERIFAEHLETAGIPDPDLVIRSSGEKRLSNFLLWQSAYAELIFTDRLWPDFQKSDLMSAIRDYNARDRRFGRIIDKAG